MKYFLCFFLLIANISFGRTKTTESAKSSTFLQQIDTATYPINRFTNIDYAFYIGHPINTFLDDLNEINPGFVLGPIFSPHKIAYGTAINVHYANNLFIYIHVNQFQFTRPYIPNRAYDINLFRQENIGEIELWNNGTCLYGCD